MKGIKGIETCPACGQEKRTVTYEYHLDVLVAVLLIAMAREVLNRRRSGLDFTAANQVHVPSLSESLAVRCRTTIASKLGLVAKCLNGKKQVPGVWVITARGFAALRGEEVPASVKVKQGEIEERVELRITLSEAFRKNREAADAAADRHRKPKGDYRLQAASYKPEEWYEIAGRLNEKVEEKQPTLM